MSSLVEALGTIFSPFLWSSLLLLQKFPLYSPAQHSGEEQDGGPLELFWASLKFISPSGSLSSQLHSFDLEGLLDFDFISLS